jgi:hypothetical protein
MCPLNLLSLNVFLGIDGFGGEYLRNVSDQLPALQTFFDFGAYTTESRNLAPTVSSTEKREAITQF